MRPTIDTLLVKSHLQMSGGDKELLKLVLCVDVRGLCEKDTMTSEFLFGENLVESMSVAKDTFKFSKSILIDSSSKSGFNYKSYSRKSQDLEAVL